MTAAATAAINGAVMLGTGNPSAASGWAGGHASQTGFKAKLSPNAVILTDTFPNLAGTVEIQTRNFASETSSIGKQTRNIGGLTDSISSLTGRMFKQTSCIVFLTRSIFTLTGSISTVTGSIISITGMIFAQPAAFLANRQHGGGLITAQAKFRKPAGKFREVLDCGSPLPLFHRKPGSAKAPEGWRSPRRWRATRRCLALETVTEFLKLF